VSGFTRLAGALACDGVPLSVIAREQGTPVHVYSGALLAERVREFDAPLAGVRHRLHYAIKANSTLAIVGRLRELGMYADANSGGELEVALRAGFAPSDVVFTGVGKTPAELERAIAVGVGALNVESLGELSRIAAIAAKCRRQARVAVRINPDVDAGTHRHISTGSTTTKFGVTIGDAREMWQAVSRNEFVRLVGLHVHVGSQLTRIEPLRDAARAVASLARDLRAEGAPLEHLDVGGGLGIAYESGQVVLSPQQYAEGILSAVGDLGLLLIFEPGRWVVGPSGVIVCEVVDLKRRDDGLWFVIVDAGMTDLMRPALYGAYHRIEPVAPRHGPSIIADVVGPVCETSDTLGSGRELPPLEVGDLMAIRDTGAYGAVMASNYNRRPLAAEVLVDDGHARTIRRRQTIDDMLRWDV
jgi:diaminopimelate decarboxylase